MKAHSAVQDCADRLNITQFEVFRKAHMLYAPATLGKKDCEAEALSDFNVWKDTNEISEIVALFIFEKP